MRNNEEWRIWSMTSLKYLVLTINREALTVSMTGSGEEELSESNVLYRDVFFDDDSKNRKYLECSLKGV